MRQNPLGCNYFKLQDMIWPYEHVMAWDHRDGWDYMAHFHSCWRMSSVKKLYEPTIPCFLSNDLEPIPECSPPEVARKQVRHRVVHLRSGHRSSRFRELAENKWEDEEGNLFMQYPIYDDAELVAPLPKIRILGVGRGGRDGSRG